MCFNTFNNYLINKDIIISLYFEIIIKIYLRKARRLYENAK